MPGNVGPPRNPLSAAAYARPLHTMSSTSAPTVQSAASSSNDGSADCPENSTLLALLPVIWPRRRPGRRRRVRPARSVSRDGVRRRVAPRGSDGGSRRPGSPRRCRSRWAHANSAPVGVSNEGRSGMASEKVPNPVRLFNPMKIRKPTYGQDPEPAADGDQRRLGSEHDPEAERGERHEDDAWQLHRLDRTGRREPLCWLVAAGPGQVTDDQAHEQSTDGQERDRPPRRRSVGSDGGRHFVNTTCWACPMPSRNR